jgi:hypothetical protein
MNHRQSPALARNKKTNTLQQPMFIRGRCHLCHGCQHTGRSSRRHPPGPTWRHHHSRHFHYPPLSNQHPLWLRQRPARDQQKRATYSRAEPNGFPFVPFSVESYGRIGQPAIKLLHALGDEVAGPGGVTRASFVAGALRESSGGSYRGHFFMFRACLGMFA